MKTYTKNGQEIAVFESKSYDATYEYVAKYGGSVTQRDKASRKNLAQDKHDYVWRWEAILPLRST
jgi:hypothetical protein